MNYRCMAVGLFIVLLAACAAKPPPQLGRTENWRYHDVGQRFSCPMPGTAQGFKGAVLIRDAVPAGDTFVPAPAVEFLDTTQPARRVSVSIAPLPPDADKDAFARAGFDAPGSGRIAIGSTSLYRLPLHYAMLQVPYGAATESTPTIELHVLGNFVIPLKGDAGFRHVQLRDVRPASSLLAPGVAVADEEAMLHALRRDTGRLREVRTEVFTWLHGCFWSTEPPETKPVSTQQTSFVN